MILHTTWMLGTHGKLVKNNGWYERPVPKSIENQDVQ